MSSLGGPTLKKKKKKKQSEQVCKSIHFISMAVLLGCVVHKNAPSLNTAKKEIKSFCDTIVT